jgi:hypothetical protein
MNTNKNNTRTAPAYTDKKIRVNRYNCNVKKRKERTPTKQNNNNNKKKGLIVRTVIIVITHNKK